MTFEGTIYKVLPIRSGLRSDGTTWSTQDFIFSFYNTPDPFVNRVLLSVGEKMFADYGLKEGDKVRIGLRHSVNEYQGKNFNRINVNSIERIVEDAPAETSEKAPEATESEQTQDGLPF